MREPSTLNYLLCIFIVFSSCESNDSMLNERLKSKIDDMAYSECSINVEIDSLGNVIDTIDLTRKKIDRQRKIVFKRREYKYNNQHYSKETYFIDQDQDFLSIAESESQDFRNVTEVFRRKNGEIERLVVLSKFENELDTLEMIYEHVYTDSGKKKKSISKVVGEEETNVYVLFYNDQEQVTTEFSTSKVDTFQRIDYYYSGELLGRIEKLTKYQDTTLTVEYINDFRKRDSVLVFRLSHGKKHANSRTVYDYDKENNYAGHNELNINTGERRIIICKKIACD